MARKSHGGWSAGRARLTRAAALTVCSAWATACSEPQETRSVHATQALATRAVVPVITASMKARLRTVYLAGVARGNRAGVFSKVGDGITARAQYLTDLGCGTENLGAFTDLAPTVSYFRATTLTSTSLVSCGVNNAFTTTSLAAEPGWSIGDVLNNANRDDCPAPENSFLRCELRRTRPATALIMIGSNDLGANDAAGYSAQLTRLVNDTIASGVIPVLSTLPPRLDDATLGARIAAYNDAILAVASAQQVPLWDYWAALQSPDLINQGISDNGIHPSTWRDQFPCDFTTPALAYGYNQRNLTALQVLRHLKDVVFDDGAPDPDPSGDGGTAADATVDATVDAAVDATPDASADATSDLAVDAADATDASADTATDAAVDSPPDVASDLASDAAVDVGIDAALDSAVDAGSDAALDSATDTASDSATDAGPAVRQVVPRIDASMKARLRTVYLAGVARGNRAGVFSKVGDGITARAQYLTDLGCGTENLGAFTDLAPTVSYFRATTLTSTSLVSCGVNNAFTTTSLAAEPGWSIGDVLNNANRDDCPAPENSFLRCELRRTRPATALIMIGSNDLGANDAAGYSAQLTRLVNDTIASGVIPVLSTLPPRLDDATLGARIAAYNDAILAVASAQQVPLWDYWAALQSPDLINQGISDNGIHPSTWLNAFPCNFTTPALAYGYNQRNLTALQVLRHLKDVVFDDGAPDPGGTPVDAGTADAATDTAADVAADTAADVAADTVADAVADTATDAATDVVDAATDVTVCPSAPPLIDPTVEAALAAQRQSCAFGAGARVADTLGVTATVRARIPVDHVVVVMQENRAFDHYLGTMPGVDGIPAGYTNTDTLGRVYTPTEHTDTCEVFDPPHQWNAMHSCWNLGAMDGFVRTGLASGVPASVTLGYYTERQLPFYRWLYGTFAMSDRYFGSVLSGTWANRDFLYMGSSYGARDTGDTVIDSRTTVFDALDAAGVSWGVYTDGDLRQDCIGWTRPHRNVGSFTQFLTQLTAGTLPSVVFVDPGSFEDEHPPANVQRGEAWERTIVTTAMVSPLWSRLAMVLTYDEAGGQFDHAPPPSACYPHAPGAAGYDTTDLNRLGVRVPMVVVSPWARAHHISHVVHDHASTLRFIETVFDIPALTARDANAAALLDLFDFSCAQSMTTGAIPPSGTGGCL